MNSRRASSSVVDVGVEAVALVGQLLEQGVVVVAHPDADRHELDAGGGVARGSRARMPSASVSPTLATPSEARTTRSMPFSVERSRGPARSRGAARPRGWSSRRAGARRWRRGSAPSSVAGVGGRTTRASSPNVTIAIESPRSSPSTSLRSEVLDELEPALALHRPRGVDDEREGGRLAVPDRATSRAWMPIRSRTSSLAEERGRAAIDDGSRTCRRSRRRIALVEGVDPLLDPDAGRDRAGCRRRRSAGRWCTRRCRRPARRSRPGPRRGRSTGLMPGSS